MKFLIALLLLIIITGCLYAQVSNVRVQQRNDGTFNVDIYYDFSNPNGYDTEIAVMASGDNGATWELACSSSNQTGDVGEDISAGTDKHIVWDFYADNPNTSGSQFKVRILYYFFSTMTGNDGTVYKTIKIGDQWWMAENLRETQYRDGTAIKVAENDYDWITCDDDMECARCVYNNDESNADTYGYIYNGYAQMNTDLAPSGWHVPTDDEWKALEIYLGMTQTQADIIGYRGTQGQQLKSITGWYLNWGGNNKTRFSALPCGYRSYMAEYRMEGTHCIYWCKGYIQLFSEEGLPYTSLVSRIIGYNNSIGRIEEELTDGCYIRLVKDD